MEIAKHEFSDPNEPVYLLSLDGGGVRGISEAVILHEIMTKIQKQLALPTLPKPCDYFHLIGGTSTGGLIAIMFGRLRMTTQEVLDEYEAIAEIIFNKKNRRLDKSFKEAKLEEAIKSVAKPRAGNTMRMAKADEDIEKGLSFVVALKKKGDDNTPSLFRSYACQGEETDCQIWEAARATTAAPGFFPPAKIKIKGKEEWFIDGAVKWNNPSRLVLSEAEARFGPHRRLGCMLSIGSGVRPSSLYENRKGYWGTAYSFTEMKRIAIDYLTDPEPPHRALKALLKDHTNSYFRFSVPAEDGEERIRIYEYQKMKALREATERYVDRQDVSMALDQLVNVICNRQSTKLTLEAVCHANSPETMLKNLTHWHRKREITSPTFTGREDILSVLGQAFHRRTPASYPRRDFRLWGVGGIGKTQIALRFTELFRDRFQRIFWIDASEPSMIYHSFENIASEVLQSPEKGPNILPVIRWLENSQEEWLLVIDNYDTGDISHFLPGYSKGNILFTSRRYDLPPQPPPESMYHVSEMDMAESTELLLKTCRREPSEWLEAQARPLIEELGSLPLAINQAGAYIRMRGCSFDRYLTKVRTEKQKVLNDAPESGGGASNKAVYATFELSWDCLKSYARGSSENAASSQSALQILNTFCFYHSEKIPVEMVLRARLGIQLTGRWRDVGLVPTQSTDEKSPIDATEGTDAAWIDPDVVLGIRCRKTDLDYDFVFSGLMMLVQFSLLKPVASDEAEYSIHPLMHSWLRDRMTPGTFDRSLRVARSILYHSYHADIQNSEAEHFYPRLLPHMKANNSHKFKGEDDTPFRERMEVQWKYGKILEGSRLWGEIIPLLQQGIHDLAYELDRDDWRTLSAMIGLGSAYMQTGRIIDAEDVLRQALDRTSCCPSLTWARRCYVHVCGELSMVYLVQGNFGVAQLMAKAAHRSARVRMKDINTLIPMTRLCLVYQYRERWKDALELADAIVNIRMELRQQGPGHHQTLKAKAELAYIQARLGGTTEAEEALTEIAQNLESDLGGDHYDTLVARTNLAWVYFVQHRLPEAEAIQREVLEAGRSVLGNDHLYTLYMMLRLGLTVGEMERYEEAIELLDECVEGRKHALWEIHPAVGGADMWRSVFQSRMEGYDYSAEISRADMAKVEQAKRWAEYSYTPVQV